MRINISRKTQGSALIVTLLTAVVIGIALASYLTLVSSQNISTMRSLAWNSTVPVLEAGIEEALTQIHHNGITNLSANGWVWTVDGLYYKKRQLDAERYYEATIEPVDPPIIVSKGFVRVPLTPSSQLGMISGTISSDSSSPSFVSRRVRVSTERDGMFTKGIVAKGQIDLAGNNIATDSFDSSDPLYNTNGRYDAAKARDNGDIASNSGLINSLNIGNAKIKGRVSTGPGGSVAHGPNGAVGSETWTDGGQKGIEPGYSSDDMNVEFPDVKAPFSGGYSTPSGGTVNGVYYNYVLGTGKYKLSSFSGKVLVVGNATLWVTDSVKFSGQDQIEIAAGASLKLYVSAATAELGGNGVINGTGNALDFQYYGLPSNTSVTFNGNASYTGTVYAPQAAFTLGGGGSDAYDFVGASVTATAKMNGHYQFHYDEALEKFGPIREYVVVSWNEF